MLIVKKYGGETLSTPEKIKSVARRLKAERDHGHDLVVIVSAMGETTDHLIELAQKVSAVPSGRELDMLLTSGERISMALMAMALHDLGCDAISFTGSQAGIFTNDAHFNAKIEDIRPHRVRESLAQKKIVILAGFQGVSPSTKEITTLGRGGSDTTAIAMASCLGADHCEILKEFPAIFNADPRAFTEAKKIPELSYEQLAEMTFWGAQVLHYRSVELASRNQLKLFIGSAHESTAGTWVKKENTLQPQFEKSQILAMQSWQHVLHLVVRGVTLGEALAKIVEPLRKRQVPLPQILKVETQGDGVHFLLAGPSETIAAARALLSQENQVTLDPIDWSTISLSVAGAGLESLHQVLIELFQKANIFLQDLFSTSLSLHVRLKSEDRERALQILGHHFLSV